MIDSILLSVLLLLPVLLSTASGTIDSSQTAVSYCRCIVHWLWTWSSTRCSTRLDNQLDTCHGLRRRYLVSFLPFTVSIYQPIYFFFSSMLPSILPCRSMLPVNGITQSMRRVSWWRGVAMMRDLFFSLLLPTNTLLSFFPPIQPSFLFVVLVFLLFVLLSMLLLLMLLLLSPSILILLSSCIMTWWHTRRLLVSCSLWYKTYAVPLLRPLLSHESLLLDATSLPLLILLSILLYSSFRLDPVVACYLVCRLVFSLLAI